MRPPILSIKLRALGCLLMGSALVALGASAIEAGTTTTSGESFSFDGNSAEWSFDLAVPEGAEMARLEVLTRIRSGRVSWTLRDPGGEARLRIHGADGTLVGDTGPMENPPAGTWKLTAVSERATGRARFEWRVE
jgi:hypothetical protein